MFLSGKDEKVTQFYVRPCGCQTATVSQSFTSGSPLTHLGLGLRFDGLFPLFWRHFCVYFTYVHSSSIGFIVALAWRWRLCLRIHSINSALVQKLAAKINKSVLCSEQNASGMFDCHQSRKVEYPPGVYLWRVWPVNIRGNEYIFDPSRMSVTH